MKKKRLIRKGYTLIELMVIIGVLLILSALSIPTFENMADRARRHVVKEALVEIRGAQLLYKHDYGGYAPVANRGDLVSKLGKYMKITQMFSNVYNQDLVYPVSVCIYDEGKGAANPNCTPYCCADDGFTMVARAKDRGNTPVTVTEKLIFPNP